MEINSLAEGYSGKEWKRDDKHRVYVVGPQGEVGYLDLLTGEFNISPKSSINYGICDEESATLIIKASPKHKIYLGQIQGSIPVESDVRDRLRDAIKSFQSLTSNADNTRVEINLGPTMEFRIKGKSHWAKANLTLAIDNGNDPLDIEKLYDATSEMVSAMLDLEINKLSER